MSINQVLDYVSVLVLVLITNAINKIVVIVLDGAVVPGYSTRNVDHKLMEFSKEIVHICSAGT